tara:strand:+ start:5176 stop:6291 length:1116 start_codon:yes stop_codon:yes gene_type:complete
MTTICYPFVGDSIGGSHKSTITLIKSLQHTRRDLSLRVLVFSANDEFRDYLSGERIPFDDIDLKLGSSSKLGIIIDIARSFFKVRKYLHKEKIDIVHTNDLRINLIFLIVCKIFRIKHLWHQRTSMPQSYLGQRIFLSCDKFVTVSNYISNQILGKFDDEKISRVYNPIDTRMCSKKDILKRSESLTKKTIVVGYIANITSQKNPDVFVELAKIAKLQKNHRFEFVMIGRVNSDFLNQIELEKKQGRLDKNFRVMGFRKEIDDCLSKIDFLIVTAEGDGFGRTIVESMRAGVLVLALNSGGHTEIIQDGIDGILIEELNAKKFMYRLLEISNDKNLYQTMLIEAHKKTKIHFTTKQHVQEISEIYKEILED